MRDRDNEDERDEPKRKRYISCSDRMCGADDCPVCRPWNFIRGVYAGDIREKYESDSKQQPL